MLKRAWARLTPSIFPRRANRRRRKPRAPRRTEKAKGLTADQVRQLQDQTDQSYTMMIQAMTEQNMKVQNLFNEGIYSLNFDGTKVGIENFMLPPVGTTPEEAQAAISEGGAYSIEAVSDRIFGLAEALSGGDSGKLSEMDNPFKIHINVI